MPSAAEIQQYLSGAWQLMLGREDGLDRLDLTTDGFWNSFYAMLIAVPALAVGWVSLTNQACGPDSLLSVRMSYVSRLATVDLLAWVVPLALLALVAGRVGIAHRFVPYVVASNWGSTLLIWLMVPVSVAELFAVDNAAIDAVTMVVFIATLVLLWRLTRTAIGMGTGVAAGVFFGMFAVSLALILWLQPLLGLQVQ